MIIRHFPTGHSHRSHERRLIYGREIFRAPDAQGSPEGGNSRIIDSINSFVDYASSLLPSNRQAMQKNGTERNMQDVQKWITALQETNILTNPAQTDIPADNPFGPSEFLKSQSPRKRQIIALRLIRSATTPAVLSSTPPFSQVRGLIAPNLDQFIAQNPDPAPLFTPPELALMNRILLVSAAGLGMRPLYQATPATPEDKQNMEIVKKMIRAHYPEARREEHLYDDYKVAITTLRTLPGRGAPTVNEMRNREEFLNALSGSLYQSFPRRLIAWLQHEDPTEVQRILTNFAQRREREEKTRTDSNLEGQRRLALKGRVEESIGDRISNFYHGIPPWAQLGAIGVGLYSGIQLFKSDDPVLSTIRNILYGAVGWTAFEKFALGTPSGQGAIAKGMRALEKSFGKNHPEQNRKVFDQMARYLDQKGFLNSEPNAFAFTIIAKADTAQVGKALRTRMERLPSGGHILRYSLDETLKKHVADVAEGSGFQRNAVDIMFKGPHAAEIAEAIATTFYNRAANNPANQERMQRIYKARRDAARLHSVTDSATGETRPFGTSLSFGNIRDKNALDDYKDMVEEGQQIAQNDHSGLPFYQFIGAIMDEGPAVRPENSERLRIPPVPGTRLKEEALYKIRNESITKNLDETNKRIKEDFAEFTNFWKNRNVLNDAAVKAITAKVHLLVDDPASRLGPTEFQQVVERIKFVILAAASGRGGNIPLTDTDLQDLTGAITVPPGSPKNPVQLLAAIGTWFNNSVLTLNSRLTPVNSLADVRSILTNRFGASVTSEAGLKRLQERLQQHEKTFREMRDTGRVAENLVASIQANDPDRINQFGNRTVAVAYFRRMLENNNEYKKHSETAESTVAQRLMNSVLRNYLGRARMNGEDIFDAAPEDRYITNTEEQNLIDESNWLVHEIATAPGIPPNGPMRGMWSAVAMNQYLSRLTGFPGLASDMNEEPRRIAEIQNIRQMAMLYMAQFPPVADEPTLNVLLRSRVRSTATSFVNHINNPANAGNRKAMLNSPSYREGMKDLYHTMILLGIHLDAADRELLGKVYNLAQIPEPTLAVSPSVPLELVAASTLTAQLNTQNDVVGKLEATLKNSTDSEGKLTATLKALENDRNVLIAQINAIPGGGKILATIANNEGQVQKLTATISDNVQEMNKLSGQIKIQQDLQTKLAANLGAPGIAGNPAAENKLKADIAAASTTIANALAASTKLANQNIALEAQIKTIQNQSEKLVAGSGNPALAGLFANLQTTMEQIQANNKVLATLQKEIAETQARLNAAIKQQQDIQKQLKAAGAI